MREKRSVVQKRKQKIFLVCVIVAVAAAVGALALKYAGRPKEQTSTATYGETSEADTILYNGKTYVYNDHLSNYLFMGIDTRQEQQEAVMQGNAGQADAIFMVSLDRVKQKLRVVMVPRDTMTQIESFNPSGKSLGMTTDHINIQYAYGDGKRKSCELMKTAVSNLLYQVPIQGYTALNMDGIPVLTELVGGVEVTVPDNSLAEVNPEFTEGAVVTLNRENTEQFVRYRDIGQTQSAIVRMNRQKAFLQAYLARVQSLASQDAGIVTNLYYGIQDYMVTNMGNDLFVKLLEASYNGIESVETIPGTGVQGEGGQEQNFDEYHVNDDGLYDLIIRTFYKEVEETE